MHGYTSLSSCIVYKGVVVNTGSITMHSHKTLQRLIEV